MGVLISLFFMYGSVDAQVHNYSPKLVHASVSLQACADGFVFHGWLNTTGQLVSLQGLPNLVLGHISPWSIRSQPFLPTGSANKLT